MKIKSRLPSQIPFQLMDTTTDLIWISSNSNQVTSKFPKTAEQETRLPEPENVINTLHHRTVCSTKFLASLDFWRMKICSLQVWLRELLETKQRQTI